MLLARERTVLLADTLVHEAPTPASSPTSRSAPRHGARARPRAARRAAVLLEFRQPDGRETAQRVREAVALLDRRKVDFEYDGEMSADVALDDG